jgi:hypothetical protein
MSRFAGSGNFSFCLIEYEIHQTYLMKFKLLQENGLENSLKNSAQTGLKTCSVLAALHQTRGTPHGRLRHKKEYTFWAVLCVLLLFSTLPECKDTNMEALLAEHPAY